MTLAAAAPQFHGANAYHAAHRFSARGIAGILAAHVFVLAFLASLDALPLPAPLATLMVEVIASTPPPANTMTPPRPMPVERKPLPKSVMPAQPQRLAAPAEAASAAAEAPVAKETPTPAAPAPTPAPVSVQQPRFDADYLQNPAPAYPALARRLGEEGKVVLRVFVEPRGRPGQIEVKAGSGSPRLDQAAQDAVWRWKFVAARRGDEAVGAWVLVPIVFNLRG